MAAHAVLMVVLRLATIMLVSLAATVQQPFLDYDCDLVHTIPGHAANWNAVFNRSVHIVRNNFLETNFSFPIDLVDLVDDPSEEDAKQNRFVSKATQAQQECPLGFLYLKLLQFHNLQTEPEAAATIHGVLRLYPSYVVALSRWPIFPLLAYFQSRDFPLDGDPPPASACQGVDGVINWDASRANAIHWVELTFQEDLDKEEVADELQPVQLAMAEDFRTVLRSVQNQEQASKECPFGFYFLVAVQLTSAAHTQTFYMPPFSRVMDQVLQDISFFEVSSSSWPVWHVLATFSDMNKGHWFYSGDRKYLRGFSDWNLRLDELNPLVSVAASGLPGEKGFLSAEWREEVMWKVEALKKMDHLSYIQTLQDWRRRREDAVGPLRPIALDMIQAASAVAAHAYHKGLQKRLAYVVLLYGDGWARVLRRMVGRMAQLKMEHPLLVIAIGAAAPVCRELMLEGQDVICWVPETNSQVHRFTGIHGLLHFGIDAIYLDMDTFLLRDPTQRFQAVAEGWDAVFARHGDGDCVNIGVFYLKASGNTAVWMSQFLVWYHDHPFEIDQRGLHVFLGLPAQAVKVANVPDDLVKIKGSVLEDLNEVVIGSIGWVGSLNQMLVFHWCHVQLKMKVHEMTFAYKAADALEDHELPLSLALSTVGGALRGSPWFKVLDLKEILVHYQRDEAPKRKICW